MIPQEIIIDWARSLDRAVRWLTSSKIYNRNPENKITYGGVNSFYDVKSKVCPLVYTEITAYAVKLLLNIYRWYDEKKYLKLAMNSGSWIINVAKYRGEDKKAMGSFTMGYDLKTQRLLERGYSFDVGVCVEALTDLYKETDKAHFLECGLDAASWLLNVMQEPDGSFKPMYDWSAKSFSTNAKNWYEAPGSFHMKLSIGLLNLWEIAGDPLYVEATERIAEWVMRQQKKNGAFRTNVHKENTNTHAHCYTLEGLLYTHGKIGQRYLNSIVKGAEWLLQVQENDGSLYLNYSKNTHDNVKPVYVVAQAIRIWIILYKLTRNVKFYDAALRAARFLLDVQNMEKFQIRTRRFVRDPDAYGSFCEAVKEYFGGLIKIKSSRMSSWTTIFSIHALSMLEDAEDADYHSSILELF